MEIIKKITIFASILGLLVSCNFGSNNENTIVNSKWVLDSMDFDVVNAEEIPYFIVGDSSKVTGYSGCNNFFGEYEMSKDSLKFNITGTTMRLCQDGGLEQKMMQLFYETVFFEQPSSDVVVLKDANMDVLAKFKNEKE